MRRLKLSLALVSAAAIGCQDLAVTNPNNPDRGRALEQPSSVEALASSAFRSWWPYVHDEDPVWALSTMADEFSAAFFDFGILVASSEPRVAYDNSQTYADNDVNEDNTNDCTGVCIGNDEDVGSGGCVAVAGQNDCGDGVVLPDPCTEDCETSCEGSDCEPSCEGPD